MLDNKDKGTKLEFFVSEKLKEVLQDEFIRPTKASGGGQRNSEIGDILSKDFFVECKNNKNNWFRKSIWTKLINSLPMGTLKIPLYIIEDDIEGKLIMLSFSDFIKLLKEKR